MFDTPILFFDVSLFYYLAIIVDFINGGANDVFDQCPTIIKTCKFNPDSTIQPTTLSLSGKIKIQKEECGIFEFWSFRKISSFLHEVHTIDSTMIIMFLDRWNCENSRNGWQ